MMYLTDHDGQVLAKLRALISSSLQLIYQLRFNHDPPLCLYRVRDLTFLPHLLESGKPSKQITVAELAQKILPTTDANTEELLNQSIERLENETHYKCNYCRGTWRTRQKRPAPHRRQSHPMPTSTSLPKKAMKCAMLHLIVLTPITRHTQYQAPHDTQAGRHPLMANRPNTAHTTAVVNHSRWEQHPVVPTPMQWPPNLQVPLSWPAGRHPLLANHQPLTHIPTHTPNTLLHPSNSSRNSSPTSPISCSTFAVTTRANNHPVSGTSPPAMLEDGRNRGALVTTNSRRSRPAYAKDPLSCKRPTGHTSKPPGSIRSFLAYTSSPQPPHLRKHTQVVGLRSLCQSGTRSSHTKPYYQDKSWLRKCNLKVPKSGSSQYIYTQTMSRKTCRSSSSTSTPSTSATGPSWQETSTGPMSNAVSYGIN